MFDFFYDLCKNIWKIHTEEKKMDKKYKKQQNNIFMQII